MANDTLTTATTPNSPGIEEQDIRRSGPKGQALRLPPSSGQSRKKERKLKTEKQTYFSPPHHLAKYPIPITKTAFHVQRTNTCHRPNIAPPRPQSCS
jgi:hypothetical protein